MKNSVLALAALASTAVSLPALAAPVSISVRTADLNLYSPAGRAALARRISTAAKTVCIVDGDRDLKSIAEGNKCYTNAVANAWSQTTLAAGGGKSVSK